MIRYRLVRQLRIAFWSPFIAYLFMMRPAERPYWSNWLRLTLDGVSATDSRSPFMPFRAMEWLEDYLAGDNKRVFEWGSGGSTLFFASRAQELVSIEHDPTWFQIVSEHLSQIDSHRCTLRHVPPTTTPSSSPIYRSGRKPKWFFERYAKAINDYPDGYFDLVIVDGRARPACVHHAKRKIRPGGVLLLDDSNRRRYRGAVASVDKAEWRKLDLSGIRPGGPAIHHTTAWFRPE